MASSVGPGGGMLLGFGTRALVDEPREKAQKNLAAQTALYSPWTGMKISEVGGMPVEGSYLENILGGEQQGKQNMQSKMSSFGGMFGGGKK